MKLRPILVLGSSLFGVVLACGSSTHNDTTQTTDAGSHEGVKLSATLLSLRKGPPGGLSQVCLSNG